MARKQKKSKKLLYIGLAAIVSGVVFLGLARSKGWIGKPPSKKVEIGEVKLTTIVEKVSASGSVRPVNEVKISPEVSGEIRELYIEEGDSIPAGKLLLGIRPDNLESILDRTIATLNTQKANYAQAKARLAQNKAQLIQAEQIFNRNKDLIAQKVISEQEFERVKAEYEVALANLDAQEQSVEAARYTVISAEASVKEARENLALTSIYSPVGGIVTRLAVEKGERVVGTQTMAGTEMLRIANLDSMEVGVNVNENDIIRVSIGDTAIIDVDSYSYKGERFKGVVTAIANSANETAGSADVVTEFEVKILILKSSYQHLIDKGQSSPFRPGMTASVDIITERKDNVVSVPLATVTTRKLDADGKQAKASDESSTAQEEEAKEVVFLYDEVEGKISLKQVKTGISDFENIEILEGLSLGDKVVSGPYLQVSRVLKEGDRVEQLTEEDKGPRK